MSIEVKDCNTLEGMEYLAKDKPYMLIPYEDGDLTFIVSIPTEEEFDFLLTSSKKLKKFSITELQQFVITAINTNDSIMCNISVVAILDRLRN